MQIFIFAVVAVVVVKTTALPYGVVMEQTGKEVGAALDNLQHVGDSDVVQVFEERMTLLKKAELIPGKVSNVEAGVKYCRDMRCGLWTCPDGWLCGMKNCNCVPPQAPVSSDKQAGGNDEITAPAEDAVTESVLCQSERCGTWLCPGGNTCGDCHCVPSDGNTAASDYQDVMSVTSYRCCGGRCGCFNCPGTSYQCNLVTCTCHIP